MATEIERKFLVSGEDWRAGATGTRYVQGYLCNENSHSVRVRLAGEHAMLTVKGGGHGIERAEFEYSIPAVDARQLLEQFAQGPLIEKTRYRVPHAGHTWEIDEFAGCNAGLIIAEVELQSADEAVELPGWIGREVSTERRYFNASLSQRPYRDWDEAEKR